MSWTQTRKNSQTFTLRRTECKIKQNILWVEAKTLLGCRQPRTPSKLHNVKSVLLKARHYESVVQNFNQDFYAFRLLIEYHLLEIEIGR